jgi:hypothetical protein
VDAVSVVVVASVALSRSHTSICVCARRGCAVALPVALTAAAAACLFLLRQLGTGKAFEVVQGQLALFLKVWASEIAADHELQAAAQRVRAEHERTWTRLRSLLQHSLCLVQHFTNLQQ